MGKRNIIRNIVRKILIPLLTKMRIIGITLREKNETNAINKIKQITSKIVDVSKTTKQNASKTVKVVTAK